MFALSFLRCVRRGVAFSLVACFAASKVGPKRSGKEGQHAVLKVACSGLLFTPSSAFGCTQRFSFGLPRISEALSAFVAWLRRFLGWAANRAVGFICSCFQANVG